MFHTQKSYATYTYHRRLYPHSWQGLRSKLTSQQTKLNLTAYISHEATDICTWLPSGASNAIPSSLIRWHQILTVLVYITSTTFVNG